MSDVQRVTEIVIGGDAEDIPEGEHPAKLDTIEVRPGVQFEGDFRVWTFTLDRGASVSGSSSTATGSRSKSYRWIKALLGRKPEPKETVKLTGLPCRVVVEHDAEGWPKVVDVLPAQSSPVSTGTDVPDVTLPF